MMENIEFITLIIGTVVAPLILSIISNDFVAAKESRKNLFDLKKHFENLLDYTLDPNINNQTKRLLLNECRRNLEKIYVEKSGMLITGHLDVMIRESFRLLALLYKKDNAAHDPNSIAVDILQIWGMLDRYTFEKSNFFKIQRLLHRSFPGRMHEISYYWITKKLNFLSNLCK